MEEFLLVSRGIPLMVVLSTAVLTLSIPGDLSVFVSGFWFVDVNLMMILESSLLDIRVAKVLTVNCVELNESRFQRTKPELKKERIRTRELREHERK
jgi:hypothetical protein